MHLPDELLNIWIWFLKINSTACPSLVTPPSLPASVPLAPTWAHFLCSEAHQPVAKRMVAGHISLNNRWRSSKPVKTERGIQAETLLDQSPHLPEIQIDSPPTDFLHPLSASNLSSFPYRCILPWPIQAKHHASPKVNVIYQKTDFQLRPWLSTLEYYSLH